MRAAWRRLEDDTQELIVGVLSASFGLALIVAVIGANAWRLT